MSTGENILMLILGIVLMVGSLWLTLSFPIGSAGKNISVLRKVYWVSLGCWALLFLLVYLWVVLGVICYLLSSICIWNFIPSGNIEQL